MNTDLKAIVLTEGDIIKAHSDFYVCNDECELYEEYGEIIIHPDEDHEIRGESVEDVWSYNSSTKEYKHIYEAPKEILDKKEKKWLKNFLRPFKDSVNYITKIRIVGNNERIIISYHNNDAYEENLYIRLPIFKKNKMYKNMKIDKEYTLGELGLFEEGMVYPLVADYKQELANKMKKIIEKNKDEMGDYYPESVHIEADELLCEVLKKEGYDELVEWFKNLEKWYS